MGRLRRKFVISYVESSFWRVSGSDAKLHQKICGFLFERWNRFCVKLADLRFFTSKAYEEDFLGRGNHSADHAYVTPATWIDECTILTDHQCALAWNSKSGNARLLFAGRLLPEKGVKTLLEAIEKVQNEISVGITIIGEGALAEECASFSRQSSSSSVKVELLKPVQYGSVFFELLRTFDAVIIPSISDEQPRLIFDAFSQGVPVLGSNTGGIAEVVENEVNGKLFAPGDAASLAETLRWASWNRDALQMMGLFALRESRLFTHRTMHARRSKIISTEYTAIAGHP
jgi:glycosyltransferase involved in cell wall biosynthesis